MANGLRVLGIDPGSAATGYGVVEVRDRSLISIAHGVITTSSRQTFPLRLQVIHQTLQAVIGQHRPGCAVLEGIFFAKNVRSALQLGQARGAALVAAVGAGLEVFEYSPLEVKSAVTGYGRASKTQVQRMVGSLIDLSSGLPATDATDALALAICHIHGMGLQKRMAKV
ncbi:MAG: crossover junction endodeoxyribonuclease RuvC [Candidatus Methylomirabilales bacterium]|nr:crossover junction endodeoxyribonuclease RuvC [candidate division NC10 bacterium]